MQHLGFPMGTMLSGNKTFLVLVCGIFFNPFGLHTLAVQSSSKPPPKPCQSLKYSSKAHLVPTAEQWW